MAMWSLTLVNGLKQLICCETSMSGASSTFISQQEWDRTYLDMGSNDPVLAVGLFEGWGATVNVIINFSKIGGAFI